MSRAHPHTTIENVHVEVAYRKRKGRTMHVDITSDADHEPGHLTVEELNPGQVKLVANTRDGLASAWITLSAEAARKLKELLP